MVHPFNERFASARDVFVWPTQVPVPKLHVDTLGVEIKVRKFHLCLDFLRKFRSVPVLYILDVLSDKLGTHAPKCADLTFTRQKLTIFVLLPGALFVDLEGLKIPTNVDA